VGVKCISAKDHKEFDQIKNFERPWNQSVWIKSISKAVTKVRLEFNSNLRDKIENAQPGVH
jgi:hypothetical protein